MSFVEEQARSRAILYRAVNAATARAFDTWLELADEMKHRMQLLRKGATRMLNRGLARALDKWMEMAYERKKLQRYARRIMHAAQVRSWYTLVAYAEQARHDMLKMKRVIMRLLKGQAAKALAKWATEVGALMRTSTRGTVLLRLMPTETLCVRTPLTTCAPRSPRAHPAHHVRTPLTTCAGGR